MSSDGDKKDGDQSGADAGAVPTHDQPDLVAVPRLPEEEAAQAAQEITPEQFQQLMQAQFRGLVMEVVQVLHLFAPHVPEADAVRLAQIVAKEQMDQSAVPLIIQSMVDPDSIAKHPTLHLYVSDQKKGQVEMKTPKRFEQIRDLHVAAQAALALAFVLCPQARAVLRAFGFSYRFAASQTPAGGRIVLSS